jgi:hypothetical protein
MSSPKCLVQRKGFYRKKIISFILTFYIFFIIIKPPDQKTVAQKNHHSDTCIYKDLQRDLCSVFYQLIYFVDSYFYQATSQLAIIT